MMITNYELIGNDTIKFYGRTKEGVRKTFTHPLLAIYYYDEKGNKINGMPTDPTLAYGVNASPIDFTRIEDRITNFYEPGVGEIEPEPVKPRWANIDIETNDKNGFPDPKFAKEEIKCYVLYDNYEDKYYIHGTKKADITDLVERIGHLRFKLFIHDTEPEMIMWLKKYLESKNVPDYLVGYNIKGFDWIYLKNRALKFGIDLELNGAVIFDIYEGYLHIKPMQDGNTLEEVMQRELGYGKVKREEIWRMSPEDLYYYCYWDVYGENQLIFKFNLIQYYINIANINNCHINQVFYATQVVYLTMMFMNNGEIKFPWKYKTTVQTVEGAHVFEPSTGIFKWVANADFSGYYPSMIITHNISPEMAIYDKDGKFIGFDKTKMGLLPRVLKKLLDLRMGIKKQIKEEKNKDKAEILKLVSEGLKYTINAFYGVFLDVEFTLYLPEVGDAITRSARETIKALAFKVESEHGYKVLYGDTDSIFIKLKSDNLNDSLIEMKELVDKINHWLNTEVNPDHNYAKLDIGEIYSSWLQTGTKKRYAGIVVYPENFQGPLKHKNMKIMGYEVKRRGNSRYTKWVQEELLYLLLTDKAKAKAFYDHENEMWNREAVAPSLIAKEVNMRKDVDEYAKGHEVVKAIENSKKRGFEIDPKVRMYLYAVKGGDKVVLNVNKEEYIKRIAIDYPAQKEICFNKPLEKLRDLIDGQINLKDFFT